MRPRTFVYVDGFNFYYGCIRRTPYRWLDLFRFCQAILPKNEIETVKYFTAIVQPTSGDNTKSVRQKTYLRALATIPWALQQSLLPPVLRDENGEIHKPPGW